MGRSQSRRGWRLRFVRQTRRSIRSVGRAGGRRWSAVARAHAGSVRARRRGSEAGSAGWATSTMTRKASWVRWGRSRAAAPRAVVAVGPPACSTRATSSPNVVTWPARAGSGAWCEARARWSWTAGRRQVGSGRRFGVWLWRPEPGRGVSVDGRRPCPPRRASAATTRRDRLPSGELTRGVSEGSQVA